MRRMAVTGLGLVSSIGNNQAEVLGSLRQGRSGIEFIPQMQALGYRCPVAGRVKSFETLASGKRFLRTMSPAACYAVVAARDALADVGMEMAAVREERVEVVVGTGAGGMNVAAWAKTQMVSHKSPSGLGAAAVAEMLNSTAALNLAV
jgi:3-oxoacyl-[acyl-carrier-protein] synthase I